MLWFLCLPSSFGRLYSYTITQSFRCSSMICGAKLLFIKPAYANQDPTWSWVMSVSFDLYLSTGLKSPNYLHPKNKQGTHKVVVFRCFRFSTQLNMWYNPVDFSRKRKDGSAVEGGSQSVGWKEKSGGVWSWIGGMCITWCGRKPIHNGGWKADGWLCLLPCILRWSLFTSKRGRGKTTLVTYSFHDGWPCEL